MTTESETRPVAEPRGTVPVTVEGDLDAPLSRWLWLVKWLLAIPHYVVLWFLWIVYSLLSIVALVSILVRRTYPRGIFDFNVGVMRWTWPSLGLVGILMLIAGFALLFTGRYPRDVFDLAMGANRWALRVGVYAGLMTDEYPPFRLDLGGREPQ